LGTLQDLRFGFRMLLKTPAITLIAVLTLALGIGANATIFSWVGALLLDPLPGVPRSGELVVLSGTSKSEPHISLSYPDYRDYRDRSRMLAGLAVQDDAALSLATHDQPERIWGEIVSGNFFDVLGVGALRGRTFAPGEDGVPGASPVAVISHGLWQTEFGADPGIVGKTITLNNHGFTVIGIMPASFRGSVSGLRFDVWVPMSMQKVIMGADRSEERGQRWLKGFGRLKPGVRLSQAQGEVQTIAADLAREYSSNQGVSAALFPIWRAPNTAQEIMGMLLLVLMGVTAVVLLIACANVANLLLARGSARQREIAIRLAMGASRWRVSRQLLTESLVLALLSGAAGVAIAFWTSGALVLLLPPVELPIGLMAGVDVRVLGFTLAVSALTALLFGLAPALHAGRTDVLGVLKEEAAKGGGKRRAVLRGTLVVAEVALSVVLLIAAGLMIRSLQKAQTFEVGFNPKNVLLASLDLFPNGYEPERGARFYAELQERLERQPGVRAVSLARRVPLGFGGSSSTSIDVEGYQPAKSESVWSFTYNVSPGYFRLLEIPLLRGRDFTPLDRPGSPLVAIVNETLARRYWKEGDPVGRRLDSGSGWTTIIGVVRDSKYRDLNEPPSPMLFLPIAQFYRPNMNLYLRTSGEPMSQVAAVVGAIHALDPTLPVYNIRRFEDHIKASSFQQRMGAGLLTVFGVLALVLSAVGIYGVISFVVSQRTPEIGIRVALGAGRRDIVRAVMRDGLTPVLLGLVLGLAAAVGVSGVLEKLLFGVSSTDFVTFLVVPLLLVGVALLACYLPARRAARVDPMVALRYE
jgi:putative ABC transport system permease protein